MHNSYNNPKSRPLIKLATLLACAAAFSAFAQTQTTPNSDAAKAPLTAVASIDIERYQGTWHQLALYPNKFQKSCASNTRAQYALQEGGSVQVINQCRTTDGKEMQAEGQARPGKNAFLANNQLAPPQLQVRFAPAWLSWLPMVWGDYWVIQLAPDYRYVVVGEPKREFLWVLARDIQISASDWATIESRLKEQGYDPAKLVREKHLP